jgi:hypothetical protein
MYHRYVANIGGWSKCEGGQLERFYCTYYIHVTLITGKKELFSRKTSATSNISLKLLHRLISNFDTTFYSNRSRFLYNYHIQVTPITGKKMHFSRKTAPPGVNKMCAVLLPPGVNQMCAELLPPNVNQMCATLLPPGVNKSVLYCCHRVSTKCVLYC